MWNWVQDYRQDLLGYLPLSGGISHATPHGWEVGIGQCNWEAVRLTLCMESDIQMTYGGVAFRYQHVKDFERDIVTWLRCRGESYFKMLDGTIAIRLSQIMQHLMAHLCLFQPELEVAVSDVNRSFTTVVVRARGLGDQACALITIPSHPYDTPTPHHASLLAQHYA